jgi:hypothetical protein
MAKNPPLEDEKKLDLSFKEGQTIKINIGKKSETSVARQKPKSSGGGMGILLPPPPGSKSTPTQPQASGGFNLFSNSSESSSAHSQIQTTKTADNLLLDFD